MAAAAAATAVVARAALNAMQKHRGGAGGRVPWCTDVCTCIHEPDSQPGFCTGLCPQTRTFTLREYSSSVFGVIARTRCTFGASVLSARSAAPPPPPPLTQPRCIGHLTKFPTPYGPDHMRLLCTPPIAQNWASELAAIPASVTTLQFDGTFDAADDATWDGAMITPESFKLSSSPVRRRSRSYTTSVPALCARAVWRGCTCAPPVSTSHSSFR